jgi:PKD repeat protein
MQDGASQSVITAFVRNAKGEPVSGLGINWSVEASDGTQVEPTTQFSVTNGDGRASTAIRAPAPPLQVPSTPLKLRVTAQPQGTDAQTLAPGIDASKHVIEVEMVPPAGIPTANRLPVAAFSISPAAINVNQTATFDASATTDEGSLCDTRCTYQWNFGDFTTDSGKVVTHTFTVPQAYTITLTVTDARGGIASATKSLTVTGPAAPIASFVVVPASPKLNIEAVLDGSASTVGAGATITKYTWDVDGAVTETAGPTFKKTFTVVRPYAIVLTVTDSLGRTSVKSGSITPTP